MNNKAFELARDLSEKPKERIFPASFRFIYLWIARGVALFMPVVWLLFSHRTLPALLGLVVAYALTMLAVGIPGTLFLTWVTRVRVTAAGIHGGTFWSTPVYMTWAEMESVEPRSFLGIPYLRVKSFRESCPALWLPLCFAQPEAFKECVVQNTSQVHPLRRSLEDGNTTQSRIASLQKR